MKPHGWIVDPGSDALEPERYELAPAARTQLELERRAFLKALGGGLAVFCVVDALPAAAQDRRGRGGEPRVPDDVAAWLRIDAQGQIEVFCGKVEVGQDIRTSLAQAVAEEMHAPLDSVTLVLGDTARVPYDMGTFGSRTTPQMAPLLRRAAAAAREALIDLAAEHWQVARDQVRVAGGQAQELGTDRTLSFGALTRGQEIARTLSADDPLTAAADWTVSGRSTPKRDGAAFVRGIHRYVSDLAVPGMLHGRVLRGPGPGSRLLALDTTRAAAMPGVQVVQEGDFVGVAAADARLAQDALAAIDARFEEADLPDGAALFARLKERSSPAGGGRDRSPGEQGSLADGLAAAQHVLEATYTVPYIAHAPLEPRAALASWDGDQLTVHTGTQRPFGVRSELAEAFHVPPDSVRVIVPDTGSGYGGKHTGDAALEAARLARAVRAPVKVVWTREEEFTWAYFRPAGVLELRSGFLADGTLTAWEHHNYNSGSSGIRTPYTVPNQLIQFHPSDSPLRQGSYRALAATANHFARECHMDELARTAGQDPLALRLRLLEEPRLRAVLEAACERFGWAGRAHGSEVGCGLACGTEKGGYVATCAEVRVAGGRIHVERLVTAFECGAQVNPGHLESQVEGAVVMGLGGALFEAVRCEGGRVRTTAFSRYRVPRFRDLPRLEVVLLNRPDLPSAGAGETPVVAVAPAIANGVLAASGVALRSLPLALPA